MARPRLATRTALVVAFAERCRLSGGGIGWREVLPDAGINPASPSEVMLVRRTVQNMVQARELVKVGQLKPPGSRVYLALYAPAAHAEPERPGGELQAAMSGWFRG